MDLKLGTMRDHLGKWNISDAVMSGFIFPPLITFLVVFETSDLHGGPLSDLQVKNQMRFATIPCTKKKGERVFQ